MEIKAVSGVNTPDWESVNMGLIGHIGDDSMTITVSSAEGVGLNEIKTINLRDWNFDPETESAMGALGFKPFTPEISNQLTNVSAQGAGERAGLQVGDTVLQINGQAVEAWQQVVNAIQSHPNAPIAVMVERAGQQVELTLIPDSRELSQGKVIGFAGIAPKSQNGRKTIDLNCNWCI